MKLLEGKTFIVTGANTGIGAVTAVELAARGARVHLACRSATKTQPVIDRIRAASGERAAEFLALDLNSLAAVRTAAAAFLQTGEPLHGLINNAGLGGQRGVTADGFELHFGVNHLGPFLFTQLLLERVKQSAPARIVNVSSKAHYNAKGIDFDVLRQKTRSVTGMAEYSVSKLSNVLHAKELAKRLAGTGVTTYSLHPGVVATDIWRRLPGILRPLVKLFMISSEEGAKTTLHCATSAAAGKETGLYYDKCAEKKPSRPARDEALAAELWRRCEEFVQA